MRPVEQIARELTTVEEARSDRLRERAVAALRSAVSADGATFYNVHLSEQGFVFGAIHTDVSNAPLREGSAVLNSPTLRITSPRPAERNRFSPGVERWVGARRRDPLVEAVYRPLGVYDDLRLLAYDGPRFVGWLGAVRRGCGRHFDRADACGLAPLIEPVVRLLVLATALDGSQANPMYLVIDPRGSLQHATPDAEAWLSASRLAVLREWVLSFNASGERFTRSIESTRAHAVRLDGVGGVAYLVSLAAMAPPNQVGIEALTPTQREIATLAATGATADDVAQALGSAEGTVRVHLRAIYKRLQIATRAELAHEVDEWRRRLR